MGDFHRQFMLSINKMDNLTGSASAWQLSLTLPSTSAGKRLNGISRMKNIGGIGLVLVCPC